MEPGPTSPPPRKSSRQRWFKRFILLATIAAVAATVSSFRIGRFYATQGYTTARTKVVYWLTGLTPDRAQIEAEWARRRELAMARTTEVLTNFYDEADEPMRNLFRVAGMDPEHGLVRHGRGEQSILFSSQVFEKDDHGRSYRFRPNTRSVWLRQITLRNGPFGLFLVPDTPAHREAAGKAGAIVDEPSITTTNAWGLRGPEPDPNAPLRGVILGDSFMQGMFNGDAQTPPVYLVERLSKLSGMNVSVVNTGHMGYSPEQYYYSLLEYGPRMKPQFVVVSVCPNDFGDEFNILKGDANWLDEAAYWLDLIHGWCRSHEAVCLLVPIPTYPQVENRRKDGYYPGLVNNIFPGPPSNYCDPLEWFLDENLRLKKQAQDTGGSVGRSQLYNRHIDDEHLSPRGAELWADVVSRRLWLLLTTARKAPQAPPPRAEVTSPTSPNEPR